MSVDGTRVGGINVTPDGRFALIVVSDRARGEQATLPVWVAKSGFVETRQLRTKVGDDQGKQRAGVIELATGKITWVDSLAGVRAAPRSSDPVGISINGKHALFRVSTTNYKDAWLVVVDLPSHARG